MASPASKFQRTESGSKERVQTIDNVAGEDGDTGSSESFSLANPDRPETTTSRISAAVVRAVTVTRRLVGLFCVDGWLFD